MYSIYTIQDNKIATTFISMSDKQRAKRKLLGIDELKYDTFDIELLSRIASETDKVFVAGLENIVDNSNYKFGLDSLFDRSNGKILLSECDKADIQFAVHNTLDIQSALMLIDEVFTEYGYQDHLNKIGIFNDIIKTSYVVDRNDPHNINMTDARKCISQLKFSDTSDKEIEAYKHSIEV